jgi:hypothetical protein
MSGSDKTYGGHAWVCDGVTYGDHSYGFKIMYLEYHPEDMIYQPYLEAINTISTTSYLYYHMNWGLKDIANGSYYQDNVSVDIYNFSESRWDLLYIKKK